MAEAEETSPAAFPFQSPVSPGRDGENSIQNSSHPHNRGEAEAEAEAEEEEERRATPPTLIPLLPTQSKPKQKKIEIRRGPIEDDQQLGWKKKPTRKQNEIDRNQLRLIGAGNTRRSH